MNPQEAINHIRQRIQVNIDRIQNLVDKSTQQKPVIIGSPADYNERCPNCNERVDFFQDKRFCQECGQALDWS